MTKRFLILSAFLLSLAACDQPQEQSAPEPADDTIATIQLPTKTAPEVRGADIPAMSGSNHTLICDGDFSEAEGFDDFLARLKQAVAAKDAAFIAGMLDENIKYDFGGGNGKTAFLTEWKLDSVPAESPFWQEMGEMLRLGGYMRTLETETVIFPCSFRKLPGNNWLKNKAEPISAFDYMVVVREDAVLLDDAGKTFRPLAYGEVVKRVSNTEDRYTTHDGLEGTIAAEVLRSPIDYRAFFQRKDGEWKMPLFIAGD